MHRNVERFDPDENADREKKSYKTGNKMKILQSRKEFKKAWTETEHKRRLAMFICIEMYTEVNFPVSSFPSRNCRI